MGHGFLAQQVGNGAHYITSSRLDGWQRVLEHGTALPPQECTHTTHKNVLIQQSNHWCHNGRRTATVLAKKWVLAAREKAQSEEKWKGYLRELQTSLSPWGASTNNTQSKSFVPPHKTSIMPSL